jgi:hypothetical protein
MVKFLMGIEEQLTVITNILEKIESKIDSLSSRLSELESAGSGVVSSGNSVSAGRSPSDVVMQEKMKDDGKVAVEGRLTCPKCGAVGKDIQEKEDRTKATHYMGGVAIYAKGYYCKKCSEQWK